MKALLSVLAGAAICSTSFSQVIYDINFQTPDQAINQIVTTGAPPDHVSAIWFGTPTVVPAFGQLTDQPLLFDSTGGTQIGLGGPYYTQIQLRFADVPLSSVDLSFDMVDSGSGHSFTVFFDTPTVRYFYFNNSQISFFNPTLPAVRNVGTYPTNPRTRG